MARVIKSSIKPIVHCNIRTLLQDGSELTKTIEAGDIVENLRYIEKQELKTISGKVKSINLSTVNKYPTTITTDYDPFDDCIIPNTLTIDGSSLYSADVRNIPAFEIVEDDGVMAVERMFVDVDLVAILTISYTDGTEKSIELKSGDMLSNVKIMNEVPGKEDYKGAFKLVAFGLSIREGQITINSLVLKSESGVIMTAPIEKILVIGGSVEITVDTVVIREEIANSSAVAMGVIKFEDNLEISKQFTITGNNFGVPANSGSRANNIIGENETVLSGVVNLTAGADVTIDGVTLTGNALSTFKEAKSVTFKNTKFIDVTPTVAKTMLMNNIQTSKSTKIVIENCYFGTPAESDNFGMYHIFELTGKIADGSSISNNYFALGCCKHNQINIYNVDDNATITIANNIFEYAGNAIRIGTKGNVKCTINITNNTYKTTDTSDDGEWAGLLLIQPYGKETVSMEHVNINISKLNNKTDIPQFMYAYMDDKTTVIDYNNLPKITYDGRDYKVKILDYRK